MIDITNWTQTQIAKIHMYDSKSQVADKQTDRYTDDDDTHCGLVIHHVIYPTVYYCTIFFLLLRYLHT